MSLSYNNFNIKNKINQSIYHGLLHFRNGRFMWDVAIVSAIIL